jgi:sterol desaturase/sphingolipid hydroxylase (fatty acid hydroxylase superfamily)
MHVPGKYAIERTSFFQFVKEHHRVHHKYMLRNLNVFFPFADIVMGTYRTATIPARMDRVADRKRERAQAAAAVLAQAAAEHQQDGNEAQTTSTKAPQGVNAG